MSKESGDRSRRHPLYLAALIGFLFIALTAVIQWYLAVIGCVAYLLAAFLLVSAFRRYQKGVEDYISTLSSRLKKVGEEALMEMPVGIVLYNQDRIIEWANRYMHELAGTGTLIKEPLDVISESVVSLIEGDAAEEIVLIRDRRFRVIPRREERLLYFFDVTEMTEAKTRYENEKTVLGIICLDNYDEITQGMDDQIKSRLNNELTNLLKDWCTAHGIYLKRFSSENFIAVFNQRILRELEKTRFDILDRVREGKKEMAVPMTVSIGIGAGVTDLMELGMMAQSALDLALSRGGDQVAIKLPSGKVKFYGGKTNPVEKRTRVRARVISHALSELINESDQVLVMGHKQPDMDAIGAAIGIMKIAEACGTPAAVVIEHERYGPGVIRLMNRIKEDENLWHRFITADEAIERVTHETLVVVVDTHKPSMVVEPRLLARSDRIVVIDHHRRGEDFIENPVLIYMEPYASSTAELVTELLEYQRKQPALSALEATALLAGITVDTKNFTLRTGSRTFDAASYLRAHGADTILVQKLLRDDLEHYYQRTRLIQNVEIYRDHIALAVGEEGDVNEQVIIAQAADALLSIDGIEASFVISLRPDGLVGISARSLGEINVQLIMESLGGGGHLTNAATQLDTSIEEAVQRLKAAIEEYFEGGESE
ncbi:DHH family phosphoesterase [Caenibacillus caldisaponilyticus]|jgi:c-di-AMP phosphodiesterase-like protein|uniref:DHH family phosphoesterase n=1 Tax=Caenibacillus caldisaponilyticus TaxID=1674942 RepID=UPI0009884DEA|nr:DHH family phosphoesterase [Caenibacillus caldisaponilyticus]